jgi:Mg/Co/Ni transporter MgtE
MVQAVYVASWFKDQEISFAVGISQITLLVSFLGGWLIPILARTYGIGSAFASGALACTFSFIIGMILIWLDNKAKSHDNQLKK